MKITVWGARGSIPSPGPETLRYGGNTTCIEIRPKSGGVVIIDAGSGLRLLGKKLLTEDDPGNLLFLFTHAHWDHLQGFPFFTPAYFSKFNITICGGPQIGRSLHFALNNQMTPPCFPVEFSAMKAHFAFTEGERSHFQVGSLEIFSIPLSHPNGGCGYKLIEDGRSFVFLTDNEPSFPHPDGVARDRYIDFCRQADLLLHDAQYTDEEYRITRGWGHSTYREATALALEAQVKRFGIFHHDPERTDADLDARVAECQGMIRDAGAEIDCFAVQEEMSFEL